MCLSLHCIYVGMHGCHVLCAALIIELQVNLLFGICTLYRLLIIISGFVKEKKNVVIYRLSVGVLYVMCFLLFY